MPRVVPYVTLRSTELEALRSTTVCARDEWLYAEEPEDQAGQPLYKKNHPKRERQCVDELLCQVCGRGLEGPPTWLIEADDLPADPSAGLLTPLPPICRSCIPVAQAECPHLKRTPMVPIEASTCAVVGVVGDVLSDDLAEIEEEQALVLSGDPRAARTIARERVVLIEEWRVCLGLGSR